MIASLDCHAEYHPNFLSKEEARTLYESLLSTYPVTRLHEIPMGAETHTTDYGKLNFLTPALFKDNALPEAQWGPSAIFPRLLEDTRQRIKVLLAVNFEVGVAIYYPDGTVGVDYHTDYAAFGDTSIIASLSVGEERLFCLRNKKTGEIFQQQLAAGSLFVMGEGCQENYEHSLPVDPIYKNPRLNITFRKFG